MANFETNKIMKGNPVPKNYQVELSNWRKYPYNSWSFVNVRNLIPTAQISVKPNSKPNFISKFIFGLLDRGVDLIDGSLGVVKKPAVGIADAIESRMQAIVDSHIRTTRDAMFRNIIFALFPLFILRIYPEIF